MRFTIKAKLASAFGAVMVLSLVVGGIAYSKLTALDVSQQSIVRQAGRMKLAADLMDAIQGQSRSEFRLLQAVKDQDIADNFKQMVERRGKAAKLKDELSDGASEDGRRLLDIITAKFQRMNELQDQTGKLAQLNSNNRAAELWATEGFPALREFQAAADAAAAESEKAPGRIEGLRAKASLLNAKFESARLARSLATTYASSSVEELEAESKGALLYLEGLRNSVTDSATRLADIELTVSDLQKGFERYAKAAGRILATAQEGGNLKAAIISKSEGRKVFNEALDATEEYVKSDQKHMKEIAEAGSEQAAFAKLLLAGVLAASMVIAVGSALWISINISRGIGRAVELAHAVAAGDLTKTVTSSSNDEVGDLTSALNHTVERLRAVVTDTLTASENMSAGSQELSASAEQLSQGATEQASASEEASASMEEMAANVKQNADNAGQTEKIAQQSALDAEASGIAVSRAVDAMQTIASKITIVQEIARQTDLLALNAAVEAARAGEHGKGFAVVASEVRKLAERSRVAAEEIVTLASSSVDQATKAGRLLDAIVPNIKQTSDLIQEIASASAEQTVGVGQISSAITQMSQATQQNAGSSEELAATSEEMSAQAQLLRQTMAFFKRSSGTSDIAPIKSDERSSILRTVAGYGPSVAAVAGDIALAAATLNGTEAEPVAV